MQTMQKFTFTFTSHCVQNVQIKILTVIWRRFLKITLNARQEKKVLKLIKQLKLLMIHIQKVKETGMLIFITHLLKAVAKNINVLSQTEM